MQCKCLYGKRQTFAVYVKRYLMKLNLIRFQEYIQYMFTVYKIKR